MSCNFNKLVGGITKKNNEKPQFKEKHNNVYQKEQGKASSVRQMPNNNAR